MADIIQLLPDNIANQIAAGEVIQRPASAVKELLENAVDAGATEIMLIVEDAGKSLIQVVDNGKGMSETDARLSFERHATSKIRKIDDLFHIKTMGFRGEALASIAAVAQVEMKSRKQEDETGTFIEIENSVVKRQEPVAMMPGTSIAMKNLFFNVPARRNFLKSNASEMRHIIDEFIRVAMAFPDIFFSLTSGGQQLYHLERGTLKQRLLQIMGQQYQSKLVTVKEQTDYLDIIGFVGKPDTAKKTRGDQYFFVNNRFIKSAYLNHAVVRAYDNLLPKDSFPLYALFISLNPSVVDINVHPTKQEIKFEDERLIYAFVESAVKHALAQFSITPTLDFELDATVQQSDALTRPDKQYDPTPQTPLFNSFARKGSAHYIENRSELQNWKAFYETEKKEVEPKETFVPLAVPMPAKREVSGLVQWQNTYIIWPSADEILLIHQQNAHERVLYERFQQALQGKPMAIQKSLFPVQVSFLPADAVLLAEIIPDLHLLGYHLEPFGQDSFIIQGTPANIPSGNEQHSLEQLLEQFKHFSAGLHYDRQEKILRTMAWQMSIKPGRSLSSREMEELVNDLFQCNMPSATPNGKPTYIQYQRDALDKLFGR